MTGAARRAVGVRTAYTEIPGRIRSWVDAILGSPVIGIEEQVGGMSPGCATRVVTETGARAFVKAVGPELNPLTPDMFRTEVTVLSHLPDHPLWARLVAALDEPGEWVALILEDVPGRHADTTSHEDIGLVLEGAAALTEQLSGRAPGLEVPTHVSGIPRAVG